MYGGVRCRIWATFGGYQPLLATLPDFSLYFVCMVHGRQVKFQNMLYIDF
jgi:hypothetical protein